MIKPILFLDLDGTIIKGKDELGHFVNTPEQVELFPEAKEMIKAHREMGYRVVLITNQGGVACGYTTIVNVTKIINRVIDGLGVEARLDSINVCPHFPGFEYDGISECFCRKPLPGMILSGISYLKDEYTDEDYTRKGSLVVGDREEDRLAAQNAGVNFLMADRWRARASHLNRVTTWEDKLSIINPVVDNLVEGNTHE